MTKTFYNEYGMTSPNNEDANSLRRRFYDNTAALVMEYVEKGYSIREIGGFLHEELSAIIAEKSLRISLDRYRKERNDSRNSQLIIKSQEETSG